jgi:hypothetical protein
MTFQFRTDLTAKTPTPELMRYIEQLEHVLGEQLADVDTNARSNLMRQFHLTSTEAGILVVLSDGRVHSKDGILSIVYSNRVEDLPDVKIVDVWVCKIRQKIAGTAIVVETQYGLGYGVRDTAPLKRAMAGEELPREAAPVVTLRARKPGDFTPTRQGQRLEEAVAALRKMADAKGLVRCVAADVSRACGLKVYGGDMLRRLEKKGLIEVIESARRGGHGSFWTVRVK